METSYLGMPVTRRVSRRGPGKATSQAEAIRERVTSLAFLWAMPAAAEAITVRFSTRLTRSLGRADLVGRRISLATWLRDDPALLDHALCHELAHVVAFILVGRSEPAHGPTWRRLMHAAGHRATTRLAAAAAPAGGAGKGEARRYRHTCPTCHFSRSAARRMPAWRCADCVAAGLDGRLEIEPLGRVE